MNFKVMAFGAAMVTGLAGVASAATTYDFESSANPAGPFSLSCSAGGTISDVCSISYTTFGLGVASEADGQPGQIDGSIAGSFEELTVTFTGLVNLISFTLGRFDLDDDFTLITDAGSIDIGPNVTNPFLVGIETSFFTIRATGAGADTRSLYDNFTLKTFTIEPVPVPAAGLLLLGGLGGLAALRRRKA